MKALSLTRPWPFTILHLGKRIENRSHKRGMPPMCAHRGPLLLHAAQSWDAGVGDWLADRGLADPHLDAEARHLRDAIHPTGIVGRCRVVGHVEPMSDGSGRFQEVDFDTLHRPAELDMRWWMGGYALVLADVVAFDTPIPCKGRLGLWTPPADVLAQVPV